MTSSAFGYLLRFLVLFGLLSASFVSSADIRFFVTGAHGTTGFHSTAQSACDQVKNNLNVYFPTTTLFGFNDLLCKFKRVEANGNVSYHEQTLQSSCTTTATTQTNSPYFTTPINPDGSVFFAGLPLTNQCADKCRGNIDLPTTLSWSTNQSVSCLVLVAGMDPNTLPCKFAFIPSGATCNKNEQPVCTPPQILNGNNVCETPSCPVGQVRQTSLGECKPIVCTAPLVKVGNECQLPKCATGETYEYKNGVGQCVKNDPVCTPPQVLVNGQCVTPSCPTGMIKNAAGSCVRDPVSNGSGGTGSGGSGSGTGTGTGTNTGNNTGTTGTNTATGTTGSGGGGTAGGTTAGAGTGTSGGSGSGGTSTNTGGTGLCQTPPCGECDPSKETCGNTFGGSCKSGYQCNGDAIQCAVAQATNKAECLLKSLQVETEDNLVYNEGKASVDAGTKALGAADGGIPVTNGGNIAIDSNNPLPSSCPADIQLFEYKGSQYKIPISNYCNIFQLMGNIMLLAASLISMKIIMKVD